MKEILLICACVAASYGGLFVFGSIREIQQQAREDADTADLTRRIRIGWQRQANELVLKEIVSAKE